ncbi:hypothetical protein H4R99_001509 [Coemansia sp. RSA 1722]|nr:hypothetical protein LPJ57_001833 [Coemansia sp. RSA 486]KAJ2234974.1 hypothetical protein IWW45_002980 [Coemansia sp. RSA 485]KAJ2604931.1 hypothetical protein H4R99_001509 [Coemansia sp. RSA 1722]KAJ2638762.1 hypothetical protein GGF40_001421 [Coemansia sp. RSA 1286]
MIKRQVVVVGAGVIGLTVANRLQSSDEFEVVVVAEEMPESNICSGSMRSTAWASPWAGAHWRAYATNQDKPLQKMEYDTYAAMLEIAETEPESGISTAPGIDLFEDHAGEKPWYAAKVRNCAEIPEEKLPKGISYGLQYTTLLINVPKYLLYLKNKFIEAGGRIHQYRLAHIHAATEFASASPEERPAILVNCTGLGSKELGGVEDTKMYPIRGQTLVVNAPDARRSITWIGKQFSYVIPRNDGTVVIGGTAEKDSWDSRPDAETSFAIMKRAIELEPNIICKGKRNKELEELVNDAISVNVGFRPGREGGVRLETQEIRDPVSGKPSSVVHCYGHAGYGYQSSIAFAECVFDKVKKAAAAAEA